MDNVEIATPFGIDTIPDEILTIVIAKVPYTRNGHARMRLVSVRFRNTVDSAALRSEVARQQFPEQTAVTDLERLESLDLLNNMARYERRLKNRARSLTQYQAERPNRMIQQVIVDGLRLLDYMGSFLAEDLDQKSHFILLLPQNILTGQHCKVLRMTIAKIYEYAMLKYDQDKLVKPVFVRVLGARNEGVEVATDMVLRLARERLFEITLLHSNEAASTSAVDTKSLHQMVDINHDEAADLTASLLSHTALANAVRTLVPSVDDDGDVLECRYWRVLSRNLDLSLPMYKGLKQRYKYGGWHHTLKSELIHRRMDKLIENVIQTGSREAFDMLQVNWFRLGKAIREFAEELATEGLSDQDSIEPEESELDESESEDSEFEETEL